MVLALSVQYGLKLEQGDVPSAFLQRSVGMGNVAAYVEQLRGLESADRSKVCSLKKGLYRTKQGCCGWFREINGTSMKEMKADFFTKAMHMRDVTRCFAEKMGEC